MPQVCDCAFCNLSPVLALCSVFIFMLSVDIFNGYFLHPLMNWTTTAEKPLFQCIISVPVCLELCIDMLRSYWEYNPFELNSKQLVGHVQLCVRLFLKLCFICNHSLFFHERRPTDKEVFPSLVCHCGTRCRSLFVTHLWQWSSSAHIWRLFCFAEHIVHSIAPLWQFRLLIFVRT